MTARGQDGESPHLPATVCAVQWQNTMKPHFFPQRVAVTQPGTSCRDEYQPARKNSRFSHHSRPVCRSSNDTFWCCFLRLAGGSRNKPQGKSLVSAVAHLTFSSTSRYLSQGQSPAHLGRAWKSQLKKKKILVCMYSTTYLPLRVCVVVWLHY